VSGQSVPQISERKDPTLVILKMVWFDILRQKLGPVVGVVVRC
jgi:hypothetical protein